MLKALDLFCGAGGVTKGLQQAGFVVHGIDLYPQPHYCGEQFTQANVLSPMLTYEWLRQFDFIWASPPCQAYTDLRHAPGAKKHPKLVDAVRSLLCSVGVPYAIENVEGAPLKDPVVLCGSHFGLHVDKWQLRRHRLIESSFHIDQPKCNHIDPVIGIYGGHVRCRSSKFWRDGGADFPAHDKPTIAKLAMGIDWMTMNELSQAIPPAYSYYVAKQFLGSK